MENLKQVSVEIMKHFDEVPREDLKVDLEKVLELDILELPEQNIGKGTENLDRKHPERMFNGSIVKNVKDPKILIEDGRYMDGNHRVGKMLPFHPSKVKSECPSFLLW